jgi:hypothetical protein
MSPAPRGETYLAKAINDELQIAKVEGYCPELD